MARYVLIKDNIVTNVIIADEDFIKSIKTKYDYIFEDDASLDGPGPGDLYDKKTKTFSKNPEEQ